MLPISPKSDRARLRWSWAPATSPSFTLERQTKPHVASPEESLSFYRNFYRTGRHNTASTDPDWHANSSTQASDLHKRILPSIRRHHVTLLESDS